MYIDDVVFLFFFFSSRRRHTRWPRDWSSDVCSSDLDILNHIELARQLKEIDVVFHLAGVVKSPYSLEDSLKYEQINQWGTARSEERRVGKEGRARWGHKHGNEKCEDSARIE